MKAIIILLTLIFLSTISVNSEENKYEGQIDNCKDYKLSPSFLICEISKAGSRFKKGLSTKKDGSQNALSKWFNAKSLADLKK